MKIKSLLIIILLILVWPVLASKIRVSDQASLVESSQELDLEKALNANSEKYQLELWMLTRDTNDITDLRPYAEHFYDSSSGPNTNGAVFIINMGTRDMGIYTFGPYRSAIEARVNDILDDLAPMLTQGQYYQAGLEFANSMHPITFWEKAKGFLTSPWLYILSAIITLITIAVLSRNSKGEVTTNEDTYESKGSFQIIASKDQYTHTTRTETRINTSSGSSGGGSSGGSHSGGGSRKF